MLIDPERWGISFSAKQCRAFQVDSSDALTWLLDQGWRRFRLMSYWNECGKVEGTYDFHELDKQIKQIQRYDGIITLCLGVKQPRWPEYHWPTWAKEQTPTQRDKALLTFIETVVTRYKDNPAIISWQLENEALLSNFGVDIQIDRRRLQQEFALIKRLDATRPIIMSTSNGWGIPARHPRPDIVGFSFYPIMYKDGAYRRTIQQPWLHRMRNRLINRPVFIHELQCEPWGPTAIWKMSVEQQDESMSVDQITQNIIMAKQIGLYPIDLWGAEWWYWRHLKHRDPTIWHAVKLQLG